MHKVPTYKFILSIAALLFLAKPFLGFSIYERLQDKAQENTLLVKVFAKRKPEFMEEATTRSIAFQMLLKKKASEFIFTFAAVLLSLFPLLTEHAITGRYFGRKKEDNSSIDPIYLLTGRLTI